MDTTTTIRIKDRGIAIGTCALILVTGIFMYRSAGDRHELERLREQNMVLTQQLKKLDKSFQRIRQYTKTAGALATADMRPTDMKQLPDFTMANAGPATSPVFGRIVLAARKAPQLIGLAETGDIENFANTLALVDDMNRDTDMVVDRLGSLATMLKYNKEVMRTVPSKMPAEGRITSEFGSRLNPYDGHRSMHEGLDIGVDVGTPVQAPADGTVTFVGNFQSLGTAVVIAHGTSQVLTRYGHLSRSKVKVGDAVKRGQVIALSGNSGHSTGPHLHYEVWVRNTAVNPRDFFFDMTDASTLAAEIPLTAKPVSHLASAEVGDEQ